METLEKLETLLPIFVQRYILGSCIWWYRYKSLEHQNKLTAYFLTFDQVASLLTIFGRLVNHSLFKPPLNLNREWYIINSRAKVEINDVAVSINLWLLEKYFEYVTCKKAFFCCYEKNH